MSYLLAISIGPVQDFIAAARKTRDLWFGSALLGDVARAAARALQQANAQLIFPALAEDQPGAPVANKILAHIDGDPAGAADQAREAAHAVLRERRDRALEVAGQRGIGDAIDRALLDAQVAGFLEWFAAWWPYDESAPGGYAAARERVERLLAGRKALRDFGPLPGRDGVPKSSLDGGRESVMRADRGLGQALLRADIRPGEQLDGISLIKRLAPERRFVSVSRVAVDPWIRRLAGDARLQQLVTIAAELVRLRSPLAQPFPGEGLSQFAAFPYDTQLFYGDGGDDPDASEAQKAPGRQFFARVREYARDIGEPPSYLAILVADGDRMGAVLGGLKSEEAHRDFSRAGSRFAARAEQVVSDQHGALVYSGGDDVLAMLPLDTALRCASDLRAAFAEAFGALPDAAAPTLSVGLAVGHYNEPLSDLLAWGREAEAYAKETRDSLAVTWQTRSGGSPVRARHWWDEQPLERYERWIKWFRQGRLPDGAAYELQELAREVRGVAGAATLVVDALPAEARRILQRKRGERGGLSPGDIALMVDERLAGNGISALEGLEMLVAELLIARHLTRAYNLAQAREATHAG